MRVTEFEALSLSLSPVTFAGFVEAETVAAAPLKEPETALTLNVYAVPAESPVTAREVEETVFETFLPLTVYSTT